MATRVPRSVRISSNRKRSSASDRIRMVSGANGGAKFGATGGLRSGVALEFALSGSAKSTTLSCGERLRWDNRGQPSSGEEAFVDVGNATNFRPASTFYEALLQLKAQDKRFSFLTTPRDVNAPDASTNRWQQPHDNGSQLVPDIERQSYVPYSHTAMLMLSREVNVPREGFWESMEKTADRLAETRFVSVLLGAVSTIPVAMAMIGVKQLENCPAEPNIPVYLLVGGCFGLLKMLSLLWRQVRFRRYRKMGDVDTTVAIDDDDYDDDNNGSIMTTTSYMFSQLLLSGFLAAWFVAGNVWVFGIWRPNFRQLLHDPNNWCDRTAYMFAFVQIVTCYTIVTLCVLGLSVAAVCRYLSSHSRVL